MLEIEAKFLHPEPARTRTALASLGATPAGTVAERDHYFSAPDRDLKATDEVVRLRTSGDTNTLTYKGPKRAGPVKSRPELNLVVQPGRDGERFATAFLESLRYTQVAVVEKRRTLYKLNQGGMECTVCLDDVAEVGRYVEVEVIAAEADESRAESVVQAIAKSLGLTELERKSYLALYLAAKGRA